MNNVTELPIGTARNIARTATRTIKRKTGMRVTLLIYPSEETIKTPEYMLHVIARSLGMPPQSFRQKSRKKDIVELRFLGSMFLRMNFPSVTLSQIAWLFGGLDHSSVISGLARANNLIFTQDQRFIDKYNTVLKSVNQWLIREESGYALASNG